MSWQQKNMTLILKDKKSTLSIILRMYIIMT